ncbi:protein unc-45 homolog B-like [Oncorhynchus kisutch]|uniref:protein unc-45 homolog B-like n=1 Tax=Oncorhynchus kisutch TaxID=8019 RepID=UPI0012DEDF76|nr:protein unc-45 homolog B-like [Oncorhynchus kisutch]
MGEMADPIQLKDEGNKHFQAGEVDKAIECYTKATKLCKDKKVLAVIYRNRSACFLKKESYTNAASDASKAIDMDAADVKALFRRCQALEKLDKLDMAFKDVQRCSIIEPKNKTILETLRRLGAEIQAKVCYQLGPFSRVQNMFDILLDEEMDKKEKAANNLEVLAREDAGAERIFQNNGVPLLLDMLETGKVEMVLAAIRTFAGMCTGHKARTMAIIHLVGIDKLCSIMAVDNEDIALATSDLFQCINDSLTGGDRRIYGKEEALVLDASKNLKSILMALLEMVASKKVSGHGRDQALNLLCRNVPRKDKKDHDHSKSLFTIDHGERKILKVCGQIPDLPDQLPMTENTQLIASVLLDKLWDDLRCDPERDHYREVCDEYIKGKFDPNDMDRNIHAINTLSGLLQGPFEVGYQLVGRQGIMEMMVALCGSEREVDQMVAVEALIHSSTKMSRASFIITNGVSLLKDIYKKTKNEKIKIRALVGLCKLGSAGGDDYSMRQFAEGSTEKLAKQCRKWLCNSAMDTKTRKWAIEGLAYLTQDADVKDDFVEVKPAMKAMFELATSKDKTILYAVACTLVNCTNSYEKKEIMPELVQLAKFSKQHVPEQHHKDKKDFIQKRVKRMLKGGVISALTVMVKADNLLLTDQTKEMLARVFLALADDAKDRGTICAHGGGKALIPLALEGSAIGKIRASHALAKIAAVSNPEIAFPGERIYEVVRPLVSLLHPERDGVQNYEALLSLTNLAGLNDKLRQAATECMCNLVTCKEVQDRYLEDGNDRLKLLVLMCAEDDEKLQRAAAGALAMLTAAQKKLCTKMTLVTLQWMEFLQRLILHDQPQIQHRGLVIVYNILNSDDNELAKKLIESKILEILTVIGKAMDNPKRQLVIDVARTCLVKAMDLGLIKPFTTPS